MSSMDASTSRPHEQSGMPPEQAFWKPLAMVGITSLVVWASIWALVELLVGFHGDEWPIAFILLLFTLLFLTPVMYYNYRRGPKARKYSRRVNILLGIYSACLAVGRIIDVSQRVAHRDLWVELVFAFAWFLLAANYIHRAFKIEDTASLPS